MHTSFILPDKRWVELRVDKNHHLTGHGDPEPSDARHDRLEPEHACEDGERSKRACYNLKEEYGTNTTAGPTLTVRNERSDEAGRSGNKVGRGEWEAPADALNGEEDEEGGRKLN